MTKKKKPAAKKTTTKRRAIREPRGPGWQEVLKVIVASVTEHLTKPASERTFTVTAFAGNATHPPAAEKLGELQLPVTEAANWSVDAIAKFPTATKFEITGRNGYSLESFTVRNGRVYPRDTFVFDGP